VPGIGAATHSQAEPLLLLLPLLLLQVLQGHEQDSGAAGGEAAEHNSLQQTFSARQLAAADKLGAQ
jgi:hypothetical protein